MSCKLLIHKHGITKWSIWQAQLFTMANASKFGGEAVDWFKLIMSMPIDVLVSEPFFLLQQKHQTIKCTAF